VYGATNPEHPAQETDPLQAKGAYAESKAAMEIAVRPFAEGDSLALTVVRSFNHTGARQTPEFVVPGFARQIARIEKNLESPTVRHGNLEAVRDFLDVRDVVRAYRQLVLETESEPWRVVNICSGQGVVIGSLLEQLIALAKVAVAQETDPERMRPSDLPVCVGSYRRLQQYTGWEPQIPLTETLRTTLDYWRTTISQEAQV
jgi:GDP-4-dehydro-6-deoxy-D-mannose reductase